MLSCGNIGGMPEKNDGFLVNDVMRAFGDSAIKDFRGRGIDMVSFRYVACK